MKDYEFGFVYIYGHFVCPEPLGPLLQFKVNVVYKFRQVLPALSPWVSSANMKISSSEEKGRSSMYIRKSIGPRILPCITDISMSSCLDLQPFTSTICLLSDK